MFNLKFQKYSNICGFFLLVLSIHFLFVQMLHGISEKFLDLKHPASNSLKYDGDSLYELCHNGWTLIDMIRSISIDDDVQIALVKEFCNLGLNICSIIIYMISQHVPSFKEAFSRCYSQIGAIKVGIEEVFCKHKLSDDYIFCTFLFSRIQNIIKLV